MKKNNVLLLIIIALLISGCSGGTDDIRKYISDMRKRPKRHIEPIPQFRPLATFKFPEHDTRRNPFKPIDTKKRTDEFAPDQKRPKQPLEAFPLDALKFVGILEEGKAVWALISSPDKKVTPIKVGEYMGQNFGKILSIKEDEIKLEETIKNSGVWEKHITTLNLNTSK